MSSSPEAKKRPLRKLALGTILTIGALATAQGERIAENSSLLSVARPDLSVTPKHFETLEQRLNNVWGAFADQLDNVSHQEAVKLQTVTIDQPGGSRVIRKQFETIVHVPKTQTTQYYEVTMSSIKPAGSSKDTTLIPDKLSIAYFHGRNPKNRLDLHDWLDSANISTALFTMTKDNATDWSVYMGYTDDSLAVGDGLDYTTDPGANIYRSLAGNERTVAAMFDQGSQLLYVAAKAQPVSDLYPIPIVPYGIEVV